MMIIPIKGYVILITQVKVSKWNVYVITSQPREP